MEEHKAGGDRARSGRYWQAHIRTLKESGLSRAEYCRQHDFSYHAFIYWQKKLYRPCWQDTQLVPIPVKKITLNQSVSTSGIKILLNDRIAIEVF